MKAKGKTFGDNSPIIGGDASGSHFGNQIFETPSKKLSVEVKTIMRLAELISKSSGEAKIRQDADKDLDKKLRVRFSPEFNSDFREMYRESLSTSGESYKVAMTQLSLSELESNSIAEWLKTESKLALREAGDDPIKAIELLHSKLVGEFSTQYKDDSEFSEQAIRTFLLEELVNCNIFPNPI